MKGKLIYIVITIMLAVTIGHTSDISAYTYDTSIAVAYADDELKRISGGFVDVSENTHTVTKEAVNAAKANAQQLLDSLLPCRWEIFFEEELAALQVEKDEDIWNAFPTYAEDPSNPFAILMQIVEAEAGTEDITGKILVANVVLNRIAAGFGTTVREVVFAPTQFDPVANGLFYTVKPSETTREAIYRAITGEDPSLGALYFCTYYKGYGYFSSWATQVVAHGAHVFFK